MVATLIRTTGDWDLAEECAQDAFALALQRWPRDGIPGKPGAWLTTAARNRAIDVLRRRAVGAAKLREVAAMSYEPSAMPHDQRRRRQRRDRRPAAADVHLLPPGAVAGGPGGADPAHAGRADHGRDRPGLPGQRADHGQAAGPGQAEDPERGHPLPGAARAPAAGAGAGRARGAVPAVQRGLLGHGGRQPGPAEPVRGGDPAGPGAGLADAGRAGGRGPAGPDAAARRAPGRAAGRGWGPGHAGGPGPIAVGRGRDRRGRVDPGGRAAAGPAGPVPGAGGHRGLPRHRARPPATPTGRRSRRCTSSSCGTCPRRWWS